MSAEWPALDARIAREVMGCSMWDELPDDARKAYWKMMETEPDDFDLAVNRDRWWFIDDSGCPDSDERIAEWQPHDDVAQALQAAQRLLNNDSYLALRIYGKKRWWVAALEQYTEDGLVASRGEQVANCAQAICSALNKWLNARGLPDGE